MRAVQPRRTVPHMVAMTGLLCVVVFSNCGPRVEEVPFGELDPARHCEVYFLRSGAPPSGFNLRNGSFYLTDPDQIAKLKARWRLTSESGPTACGSEYTVYMLEDGKPVNVVNINGPCGYLETSSGWFDFDTLLYEEIDRSSMQGIGQDKVDSLYVVLSALFGP